MILRPHHSTAARQMQRSATRRCTHLAAQRTARPRARDSRHLRVARVLLGPGQGVNRNAWRRLTLAWREPSIGSASVESTRGQGVKGIRPIRVFEEFRTFTNQRGRESVWC